MYKFDSIGSTYISLPPNLQTPENECFGYALDKQMKKFHSLAQKLTVWSDLDHVDPKYYDYLAMTIRAPYYKSEYANDQKLEIIKSALMTRRLAGTTKAIDELLSNTFGGAVFVPWFRYDGKPYHFKIVISEEPEEDAKVLFEAMLQRVKAARSIIDGVEITRKIQGTWYTAAAFIIKKDIAISKGE